MIGSNTKEDPPNLKNPYFIFFKLPRLVALIPKSRKTRATNVRVPGLGSFELPTHRKIK